LLPPWAVQFVAHTLPFTEIALGFLVLIGWRLRIWASLLTAIMFGFFFVVLRAYLLHMDINCGCFATPEPINLKKVLEDAAMATLAVLMTAFAFLEAASPTLGLPPNLPSLRPPPNPIRPLLHPTLHPRRPPAHLILDNISNCVILSGG